MQEASHGLHLVEHLALVVDGAPRAALAVDDHRLERRVVPLVEGVDGLDVVMTVDEHGRRGGTGVEMVGVHRRKAGRLDDPDVLQPGVLQQVGGELGRAAHVAGVRGLRRDRRDAQPVEQRGHDPIALGRDVVGEEELGHLHGW